MECSHNSYRNPHSLHEGQTYMCPEDSKDVNYMMRTHALKQTRLVGIGGKIFDLPVLV